METKRIKNKEMKKRNLLAGLIFLLSIVLSVLFYVYKDFFEGARSLGLLGIFLINAISSASLFLSGPAFLTVFAGGSLYSPVLVAIAGSVGSALGDMVGYLLGISGSKLLNHKLEKQLWFRAVKALFLRHATWALFFMAFIPNIFFDSIGILAGIMGFSPIRYLIIVIIARFLRFVLLADIGSRF